jgi:hypothetical protein
MTAWGVAAWGMTVWGRGGRSRRDVPQGLKPNLIVRCGRAKPEGLAYLEARANNNRADTGGPSKPEAKASGYQAWLT